MSLADLWQDQDHVAANVAAVDMDPEIRMKRRLQTEAARSARAVSRALSQASDAAAVPPLVDEAFPERLQREHLTSAGYSHCRKHEYQDVDSRHASTRERGRCIKSFLDHMARTITSMFLGEGRQETDTKLTHVLNTVISDDTSTKLRSHRTDKVDVFTIMNTSQALFFRYGGGGCENLSMPMPLQVLPSGKADAIHAAFRAWLAVTASGIGMKLLQLKCPAEIAACPKHQTVVLMGDALRANDSAWRRERTLLLDERAKADNIDAVPHRTYGIRMRCSNHQISLARKPVILSFNQFWPTLVRLGHLFETNSFRRSLAASLIALYQNGANFQSFLTISCQFSFVN